MKIYDVIKQLEMLIQENNSSVSLVLHRNMQTHPVIKVMKRFNYTLYLVSKGEKQKLLEKTFVDKCPLGDIDDIWEKQDLVFIFNLLKWMDTEEYKKLRHGVQSISDIDNGGRD